MHEVVIGEWSSRPRSWDLNLKSKTPQSASATSSTHYDAVFYGSLPLVKSQSMRWSLLRSEITFYDMFLSSDLISCKLFLWFWRSENGRQKLQASKESIHFSQDKHSKVASANVRQTSLQALYEWVKPTADATDDSQWILQICDII